MRQKVNLSDCILNINNKIIEEKEKYAKLSQEAEDTIERNSKGKEFLVAQERTVQAKYTYFNKDRIFKPVNNYNFPTNDPLRIYYNLIEYGMNKDISFQKNLIDLLKKKGLVEETAKDKETSN